MTEKPVVHLTWRFKSGLILLILCAGYSSWQGFLKNNPFIFLDRFERTGKIAADKISQFDDQIICVRSALAPNERVGFVTTYEGADWLQVYSWAQYALAPNIVIPSQTTQKIIAVYPGIDRLKQARDDGYEILVNCKNGFGLVTPVEVK